MRIAPILNHNWHNDEFQVTVQEIHELVSNQEETDTRVVLYLSYAVKLGYKSAVVRTYSYSLSSYTMLTPSHSPSTSILGLGNIVKL